MEMKKDPFRHVMIGLSSLHMLSEHVSTVFESVSFGCDGGVQLKLLCCLQGALGGLFR